MATNLRLTDLGRNAILDDENVGTRAVQITKLALGAGSGTGGADDDGRTTLRDQRDIVAATGSASVAGQIAVRAEFDSANAYAATEMGLFARIGAAGAEFLFAYWTDDGTVFINKPASLRTIIAATIALVRSAAAVEVTLAPKIAVGTVAALLDLTDSPSSYVNAAKRKVVVKADGTGVEFTEGLLDHEAAGDAETRAGLLRTKAVTPAGLKAVVDDLLNGAPGALDTLNELADALGDDPNFSATITALINRRLTQTAADARYRDDVLASDVGVGTERGTQPLASPLNDYRWIGIVGGKSASDYGTYLRVPRSQITALSGSVSYLAARVSGRNFQLYGLNVTTGALTPIGAQQALSPPNIVFSGAGMLEISGTVYAVLSNDQNEKIQLYSVDTATGALTAIGNGHTIGQHPVAVGAAKSGSDAFVLIAQLSTLRLFSINVATGVFTAIGAGTATGQYKYGVGLVEEGGSLRAATTESSADKFQLYAVNKTTGAVTETGRTHTTSHGNGAALDLLNVERRLVAGISTASGSAFRLYSVDAATGALSPIGAQQNPGASFGGLGLVANGSISGGAWAGRLRLDRAGASSLGLRSIDGMHVHQVLGLS